MWLAVKVQDIMKPRRAAFGDRTIVPHIPSQMRLSTARYQPPAKGRYPRPLGDGQHGLERAASHTGHELGAQ